VYGLLQGKKDGARETPGIKMHWYDICIFNFGWFLTGLKLKMKKKRLLTIQASNQIQTMLQVVLLNQILPTLRLSLKETPQRGVEQGPAEVKTEMMLKN